MIEGEFAICFIVFLVYVEHEQP